MTKLDLLIFYVSLFAMSQLETFANSLLKVFSKFLRLLSAWSKFVSFAKIKNLRKFEFENLYRRTPVCGIMFPVFPICNS